MKKNLHKLALLGLLIALLPSCRSIYGTSKPGPSRSWDHWNASSVPPRVGRFWLGYDSDIHGSYFDKLSTDLSHVRKTCQRFFLNRNEDNPFQY